MCESQLGAGAGDRRGRRHYRLHYHHYRLHYHLCLIAVITHISAKTNAMAVSAQSFSGVSIVVVLKCGTLCTHQLTCLLEQRQPLIGPSHGWTG